MLPLLNNNESPKFHEPFINNCPEFSPIFSVIGIPTYKLTS